jgi:hypothetical protein
MRLFSIAVSHHKSKEEALGHIYNTYGHAYLKDGKAECVLTHGNYFWGRANFEFAIINKNKSISIDMQDKIQKNKFKTLFEEMLSDWKDTGHHNGVYDDHSMELSDMHWRTTLPKGYKLLEPGDTPQPDDIEYQGSGKRRYWGKLSWYHVKKIKKGQGFYWLDKEGNVRKQVEGHIEPLIARKIK